MTVEVSADNAAAIDEYISWLEEQAQDKADMAFSAPLESNDRCAFVGLPNDYTKELPLNLSGRIDTFTTHKRASERIEREKQLEGLLEANAQLERGAVAVLTDRLRKQGMTEVAIQQLKARKAPFVRVAVMGLLQLRNRKPKPAKEVHFKLIHEVYGDLNFNDMWLPRRMSSKWKAVDWMEFISAAESQSTPPLDVTMARGDGWQWKKGCWTYQICEQGQTASLEAAAWKPVRNEMELIIMHKEISEKQKSTKTEVVPWITHQITHQFLKEQREKREQEKKRMAPELLDKHGKPYFKEDIEWDVVIEHALTRKPKLSMTALSDVPIAEKDAELLNCKPPDHLPISPILMMS